MTEKYLYQENLTHQHNVELFQLDPSQAVALINADPRPEQLVVFVHPFFNFSHLLRHQSDVVDNSGNFDPELFAVDPRLELYTTKLKRFLSQNRTNRIGLWEEDSQIDLSLQKICTLGYQGTILWTRTRDCDSRTFDKYQKEGHQLLGDLAESSSLERIIVGGIRLESNSILARPKPVINTWDLESVGAHGCVGMFSRRLGRYLRETDIQILASPITFPQSHSWISYHRPA